MNVIQYIKSHKVVLSLVAEDAAFIGLFLLDKLLLSGKIPVEYLVYARLVSAAAKAYFLKRHIIVKTPTQVESDAINFLDTAIVNPIHQKLNSITRSSIAAQEILAFAKANKPLTEEAASTLINQVMTVKEEDVAKGILAKLTPIEQALIMKPSSS